MIDPKVSGMVSREIDGNAIVVFDEAHNIDNICVEGFSFISILFHPKSI
jgi:DNA excision repair protein ERCC-2